MKKALTILLVALLVVAAFLPALAGTGAGAKFVSSRASAGIPGAIEVSGLGLSWGAGQTVARVAVLDPEGAEVAAISDIRLAEFSLWGALLGNRDPGPVSVGQLVARIERGEEGPSNLEAALADPNSPPQTASGPGPMALILGLDLADGKVDFVGPDSTLAVSAIKVAPNGGGGRVVTALVAVGGVRAPLELTVTTGTAQVELRAEGMPVALLDALAGTDGTLVAALGKRATLEATLEAGEGGDLLLRADSPTTSIRLHGAGQTALALREDATATMEVTPELGAKVLVAVSPFLMTAIGSDEPVRATVLGPSFHLPLTPFDLASVVADVEVEVGSVLIAEGGPLEAVLEALGENSPPETLASFSPVAIHLEGGVATYARSWMDAGPVRVGMEGTVDLVADSLNLRLVIPKATLLYLMGDMASGLAEGYEFVVRVTGTIANPEIDTEEILGKLASLLAESVLGNPDALDSILDSLGGIFR